MSRFIRLLDRLAWVAACLLIWAAAHQVGWGPQAFWGLAALTLYLAHRRKKQEIKP